MRSMRFPTQSKRARPAVNPLQQSSQLRSQLRNIGLPEDSIRDPRHFGEADGPVRRRPLHGTWDGRIERPPSLTNSRRSLQGGKGQIVGPPWLDEDCFEIVGKMPEGATSDQMVERFQLAAVRRIARPCVCVDRGQKTARNSGSGSIKGSMGMASLTVFRTDWTIQCKILPGSKEPTISTSPGRPIRPSNTGVARIKAGTAQGAARSAGHRPHQRIPTEN